MERRDRQRKDRIIAEKEVSSSSEGCPVCAKYLQPEADELAGRMTPALRAQLLMEYKCGTCGATHFKYPTKEHLGFPVRGVGCTSKINFSIQEDAAGLLRILDDLGLKYSCWCGTAGPLADLKLEIYECPRQKCDWHISPEPGARALLPVWNAETLEIVRSNWGSKPPWEIAREVNRFLFHQAPRGACTHSSNTAAAGGGVIYKAWEMGHIPSEEDRDQMIKKAKADFRKLKCSHGRKVQACVECYFGVEPETGAK